MKFKRSLVTLIMLGLLSVTGNAFADELLSVGVSRSRILDGDGVSQVAVADPEIADVIVSGNEVILIGKKTGATSLHIWKWGNRTSYTVVVDGSNTASSEVIKNAIGYAGVDVNVVGNKVILEGMVVGQYERNRAEKIAAAYGGEVVNLLEMAAPKQIRIEARVVEISSNKSKDLGIIYGNADSSNNSSSSDDINLKGTNLFMFGQSAKNSIDRHHGGNPFHWFGSYANINAQLNLMVAKGDAKVLSQPYVITMSGSKAEVLIGGQIPVPVSNDGDISIEWKDYGIKLNIEPNVQQNNSVDTKIQTEVSSLDYANAVKLEGYATPGLITRKADTHVLMKPGMTMAIGGLISSEQSKNITKIPILGDIPILGHFFRSTSKSKQQREIIILLTPVLVDADYMPIASEEARRIARLKDEEVLRGDVYVEPKKKK